MACPGEAVVLDSALSTQHSALAGDRGRDCWRRWSTLNALANGLVWDDPIVLNRQLLAFRTLHDIIFTPRNIPQYSPDYYRPLTTLSYLLDRAIAGNAPFMFHLSVVVYHVVATYLVFRLGLALFSAPRSPAGRRLWRGTVCRASDPQRVGGVGRRTLRRPGVLLLAARGAGVPPGGLDGRGRARRGRCAVFVAALAKETAASFFVLVPAMDIILGPLALAGGGAGARRTSPAARASRAASRIRLRLYMCRSSSRCSLYLGLRQAALEHRSSATARRRASPCCSQSSAALGVYLGKLLLPISQCAYISDLPTGPLALTAIVAAARRHRPPRRGWRGSRGQASGDLSPAVDRADVGAVADHRRQDSGRTDCRALSVSPVGGLLSAGRLRRGPPRRARRPARPSSRRWRC